MPEKQNQAVGRVALYGWKTEEQRYVLVQQKEDGGIDDGIQTLLAPFIGQFVTVTIAVDPVDAVDPEKK